MNAQQTLTTVAKHVTEITYTSGILSVELSGDLPAVHVSAQVLAAAAKDTDGVLQISPFGSLNGVWRAVIETDGVRFFATVFEENAGLFGYYVNEAGALAKLPSVSAA